MTEYKITQPNEEPQYDPIAKSWREASSFNAAWMKHGEKMTWTQRIGFAIFSFVLFSFGLVCLSLVLSYLRNWDIVGAIGWGFPVWYSSFPEHLV